VFRFAALERPLFPVCAKRPLLLLLDWSVNSLFFPPFLFVRPLGVSLLSPPFFAQRRSVLGRFVSNFPVGTSSLFSLPVFPNNPRRFFFHPRVPHPFLFLSRTGIFPRTAREDSPPSTTFYFTAPLRLAHACGWRQFGTNWRYWRVSLICTPPEGPAYPVEPSLRCGLLLMGDHPASPLRRIWFWLVFQWKSRPPYGNSL